MLNSGSGAMTATILGRALSLWEERAGALRNDRSLKAVHDFRVASRRLMVAVEAASKAVCKDVSGAVKVLKTCLKTTGPLSDAQTSIKIAAELAPRWPSLECLCRFLAEEEKNLLGDTDGCVTEKGIRAVSLAVSGLASAAGNAGEGAESDLKLLLSLQKQLGRESRRLAGALKKLDPSEDGSIHDLRIRVRRTRYVIELLRHFTGDAVSENIESARTLQTLMGDIHDYETLLAGLERMAGRGEDIPGDPAVIGDGLASRRKKLVVKLMKNSKKLIGSLTASPLAGRTGPGRVEKRTLAVSGSVTIVLLRHATALDRATPGIASDSARPLTKEGKKEAKRAARSLRAFGLKADKILTSPCLRALETARIAAGRLGLEKTVQIAEELSPGGSPDGALSTIAGLRPGSCAILVGHEPFLSSLAALLMGADGAAISLKKGGALVLKSHGTGEGRGWSLESLLTPAQMKAMV